MQGRFLLGGFLQDLVGEKDRLSPPRLPGAQAHFREPPRLGRPAQPLHHLGVCLGQKGQGEE